MVEATLVSGVSIAQVARAYRVNANQLFHWRKLYEGGLLEAPSMMPVKLLPVQVEDDATHVAMGPVASIAAKSQSARAGSIRVEIAAKARMTIEGLDEHSLRTVLECFLR